MRQVAMHIVNSDPNDLTGNEIKEKPQGFGYKVHYDRATQQWSVSTDKRLHMISRLSTSKFYYVNMKPFRYLRDAVLQILLLDKVI